MLLSDLGADVIRVERTDTAAKAGPAVPGDIVNRGRRSLAVDLKSTAGTSFVLHLVGRADALLDPYRPGAAERLGIGPDECLARRPELVYGRMTGWGQDGPLAGTPVTTSTTWRSRARWLTSGGPASRRCRR